MMNRFDYAPAASINAVWLTIASLMAVGVLAVGLLSTPATASADSPVTNCAAGVANAVCVGQINGNGVNVNIGDVTITPDTDLSAFTADLDNVFVSLVNIYDINILSADLNATVQTIVNNTFNTTTKSCAVFVTPPAGASSTITVTCS